MHRNRAHFEAWRERIDEQDWLDRLAEDYRKHGFRPSTKPLPSQRYDDPQDWRQQFSCDTYGEPVSSVSNAILALDSAWTLSGVLARRDDGLVIVKARLPWEWGPDHDARPITAVDVTEIQNWLQRDCGLVRISRSEAWRAIEAVAAANRWEGEL